MHIIPSPVRILLTGRLIIFFVVIFSPMCVLFDIIELLDHFIFHCTSAEIFRFKIVTIKFLQVIWAELVIINYIYCHVMPNFRSMRGFLAVYKILLPLFNPLPTSGTTISSTTFYLSSPARLVCSNFH